MQRHSIYTILLLQAQGWFHGGLSDSKWCPQLYVPDPSSWSTLLLQVLLGCKAQIQVETNDSPRAWSPGHRTEVGVGRKGSMGELRQHGFRKMNIAFWHGTMLRHFECHGPSQKYLLIPKEAYRLQLHFVNFNRETWVAFRNFGLGVHPASHFCLYKTSAQPAHTYPGANLKQPWWMNGIIPGLSVQ